MATTIALCMIVRDEAAALPRCLASARRWVDEIVVVDTGSTDATPAIARSWGARVVDWAWRDDFAAARNESLRHATAAWILVLDADETLAEGAGKALRQACETAGDDVVGFLVKIVCPREGDGGLVRLNWFPRVVRNLPGVRFEGVIHEQVIGSLAGRGRVERAPVEVQHRGYTLTPERMAAKARRNVRLLERQLRDDPTYAPGWFQLGETCVLLGDLDRAVDAYRRSLRTLDVARLTLPPGVVAVALQNLGAALLARGDAEDGVRALEEALTVEPDLAPAHVHLGNHAMARREYEVAERHFELALELAARAGDEGEYQVSPWLIHFLRGCAQGRLERFDEAIASFETALALEPRHAESLWLLALMAASVHDWGRCASALDRLAVLGRDDFAFHAQHAQALAGLGRPAEALAAAERALARDPASTPVLAVAAEALARLGRPAEAAAAYERVAAASPDPVPALLALAQCHEAAGDRAAMLAAYGRAVERAPDAPHVLFSLGSACLRADELDAAEECLAAAVAREPDRADYRLNHALCLLKRGVSDDALAAIEGLAERWPDRAEVGQLRALAARLAATTLRFDGGGADHPPYVAPTTAGRG
jgi:tetratricopeptide (TPR) repeat protein